MTSIKITPDDLGVQSLRADNTKPEAAKSVAALSGSRAIHKASGPPPEQALLRTERRQGERRKLERRQTDKSVILDTRSHHERRSQPGQRRTDKTTTQQPMPHGIDEEV